VDIRLVHLLADCAVLGQASQVDNEPGQAHDGRGRLKQRRQGWCHARAIPHPHKSHPNHAWLKVPSPNSGTQHLTHRGMSRTTRQATKRTKRQRLQRQERRYHLLHCGTQGWKSCQMLHERQIRALVLSCVPWVWETFRTGRSLATAGYVSFANAALVLVCNTLARRLNIVVNREDCQELTPTKATATCCQCACQKHAAS
jgi:hypothetical protein